MVEMLVQVTRFDHAGSQSRPLMDDSASMPEELVKLVVGVMGYDAEMEFKASRNALRKAEKSPRTEG